MSDRNYLIALAVLAMTFALIGKAAQAGSNTAVLPYPAHMAADEIRDHIRCKYFADNWFQKGRCDGGTPASWDDGTVRGPGADDAASSNSIGRPDRPERRDRRDRNADCRR